MRVSKQMMQSPKQTASQKSEFKVSYYEGLTAQRRKIYASLFSQSGSVLLGLGCADGSVTLQVSKMVKSSVNLGIDFDNDSLMKANAKEILALKADLNSVFPLVDESVDVVSSDQVIEHLTNVDNFVAEIFRVLKPGGYAVISTENLSSWHNIFALMMGKQAFSQQISSKYQIGNPYSLHYKEQLNSFPHVHIFTIQGLRDIFEVYGFYVEKVRGIGYFPFPNQVSKFFEAIDPTHTYFLAIKVKKPRKK
jgi:ubiquinone/menaquinone biosynthesis C-methylase UbiE